MLLRGNRFTVFPRDGVFRQVSYISMLLRENRFIKSARDGLFPKVSLFPCYSVKICLVRLHGRSYPLS